MDLLNYYKIYTKVLSKKIMDGKKDYYNNLIMHSNNKIATTWKIIKKERGKTCTRDNITKMDVNGTTTCNPQIICDAINQYFLSVGNNNLIRSQNLASKCLPYPHQQLGEKNSLCKVDSTRAQR
jgi:hypothetical protein